MWPAPEQRFDAASSSGPRTREPVVSGPVITDITCGAFRRLQPESLQDGRVHRFVVGEDTRVRVLDADDAARELGDPFATVLLLRGIFPRTAGEVLEALQREAPDLGEPLFFLLGEGSQIPMSAATEGVSRRLRFLVAHGVGNEGADVLVSAFHPDEGTVELMAWDRRAGGFNYYQTVGPSSAWVFAGNSRHALVDPTQGKGPFESHLSGNVVMRSCVFPGCTGIRSRRTSCRRCSRRTRRSSVTPG
jgi:hypothetical protein